MCGIGGIVLQPGVEQNVRRLLEHVIQIQQHRGPDGNGIWLNEAATVGFCHNRLAILDLSPAGAQPMRSSDGRFVVVYNGEIYNYQELRLALVGKGVLFRSSSDTEVLIEAYRAWGEGILLRLRGMFAFAIYDAVAGTLFCARDRVGKKPFVYAQTPSGFAFASEIPAVRIMPGVDLSIDQSALAAMLLHNLRHIPDPYTAYVGIQRLRAGHAMRVRDGAIERVWRYWDPQPSAVPITAENLRATLEESVRLRMRADVPVGALLSGGIDSSTIVSLMQKHTKVPIHTYALGFDAQDEDLRRARIMAKRLGTSHKEFYFDPEEQRAIFQKLLKVYGEPIMLLPLVHIYSLCRAVRDDGIKVVMSGNGADELFYGYTGHIRTLKISRWLDRVSCLRPFFAPFAKGRLAWLSAPAGKRKASYYEALANSEWADILSEDGKQHLANRAAEEMNYWGVLCPSKRFIDESNFVGLMVENTHSVTTAGDLPAMAASIEMRSPFLDQDVLSFALATPVELKIPSIDNPNWLKAILRDAVSDIIPAELLSAPKRGFGMGIQESTIFSGPWKQHAEELFSMPMDAGGLFNTKSIEKLWSEFMNKPSAASRIAKMFAIQQWLLDQRQ
ncbi:asparagine synthase (glutamine-hydrolyzing) [Propionivibrio sp.]|uniref:asparagine synthase (glutamine-hydrolyzing) n=1 Tax=Propionivibrio sp. TaxID=2212460 RepID=UPI0026304051|nr:asparagine synthase (glutamine-hydrolyzing) [Propionivibrio sp.]